MPVSLESRYRGVLLGLAAGDALGTTLEFKAPGSFTPLADMVGGGPFGLQPGQWTDDTSMALCLAESLVECRGFDARDQMERYLRWWQEGYLSSTGTCFDIGNTVRAALSAYRSSANPYSGSTSETSAGNGSLMRLGPVPLAYRRNPAKAMAAAVASSRTTHGALECLDACRVWSGLLLAALQGWSKHDLCAAPWQELPGFAAGDTLAPAVESVISGSYRHRQPPQIRGTGYVVQSLEAALWAFYHGGDFREGALLAANLGDDADTTAAIYGQLAGAVYGEAGIPEGWRARLTRREFIENLSDALLTLSETLGEDMPSFQAHQETSA
ncbi:ADP-ribosylglycohydrolase family protein [Thioalkalivibrio sulfidiphilus]|uniref:ADP-ribosylglycohydrolase family protein n=1 Tax=Thioalkalivibrio sulfidiphilus TaxID=1033854 RepID=UPI003B2B0C03